MVGSVPKSASPRRARARVVILGGGFGGLAAARRLPRSIDVVVVDATADFEFLPNIHELVSGIKRPSDLRLPREAVVRRAGHAFVQARVVSIDPEARRVRLSTGSELRYDALVVALGGVNDTFGVAGAERHALPFKSVGDCHAIGRALRGLEGSSAASSVVVVGAGLEGVEALGEILRRQARARQIEVSLVDARSRLLADAPASIDRELRAHCSPLPVEMHLGARVQEVREGEVVLEDGSTIASDLTLWTGGAKAPELLSEVGLSDGPGAFARARQTLQSEGREEVFVIGDAAQLTPALSKQAYHALDMGDLCGRNVERLLRGAPLLPFVTGDKPTLVSFGHLDTFLVTKGTVLAGRALAPLKEAVYQLVMAQLDRPVAPAPILGVLGRLGRSVTDRLVPSLGSVAELRALGGVRVLWERRR